LKVEGKPFWFHKNHCTRHRPPDPPGHFPEPSGSEHAERAAHSLPQDTSSSTSPASSSSGSLSPNGQRRSARLAARSRHRLQSSESEHSPDTPDRHSDPLADTGGPASQELPQDGPPATEERCLQHLQSSDGGVARSSDGPSPACPSPLSPQEEAPGSSDPQTFTYPPTPGRDWFASDSD